MPTVECAWCGAELERSLYRINRSKRHFCNRDCYSSWRDARNVEIRCDFCGAKLIKWPSRVQNHNFCDVDCKRKWQSQAFKGENHPNYQRIAVLCNYCSVEVKKPPCEIERAEHHFCSSKCHSLWMSENELGEDHFNWRRIKVRCAYCGELLDRMRNHVERVENSFCDNDCFARWRSENVVGKEHPRWRGGRLPYYGPNWNRQRKLALERDGYTCQKCHVHERDLNRSLDVHHVRPFRSFIEDYGWEVESDGIASDELLGIINVVFEEANKLENLISLCPTCHRIEEEKNGD